MDAKKVVKLIQSNNQKLKAYAGVEVDQTRLAEISRVYASILGMKSDISVGLIYQSCLHLLYTTPDSTTLIETFRRIASNDKFIWSGYTIPIWRGEPVNVSIGVVKATEKKSHKSSLVHLYFRVLSGIPAGMLLDMKAPAWWTIQIMKRKLGLWRTPYSIHPTDIAGMTCTVRLYLKDSERIVWDNINTNKTQKDNNRRLIHARYSERPCGLSHPCCECTSTRRQCPLAVL